MKIVKSSEKSDLIKIEIPDIEVSIIFDHAHNFVRHYSIRVCNERLKDIALVDRYGTLDLIAEDKKLLAYSQDLDEKIIAGIYFATIHPFTFEEEQHYLVYLDTDAVYLLQLDSQFDVATVYRQMRGDELRKLMAC